MSLPIFTRLSVSIIAIIFSTCINSQENNSSQQEAEILYPSKWISSVSKKISKLESKISRKSEKLLTSLQRKEEKIYRKLLRTKDSLSAKASLADMNKKYDGLRQKLESPAAIGTKIPYVAKLDTLSTALKFLDQAGSEGKIRDALDKTHALQDKLGKAEEIKQFIRERKQQLKQQLENLGMLKELKKFNKEVYYYSAQISEYKEILKDSKKAEKKVIELLAKTKAFRDFMRKNSQLASLFGTSAPGNSGPLNVASLAGLQTRAQVSSLIQQQLSNGGPGAQAQFSQSIQQVQSQLNELKDKVLKAGGNTGNDDVPDFKPNNQKTKSFFRRLEYGTNVQTQKANNFFPATTDIGLSAGYKLNDKSVIGIGASYKMGLGRGWNNMRFSHQGIGLRTFIDWKIKGGLYMSGGFEQNYRSAFQDFSQLRNMSGWQQSGLIGLSKMISLKSKFFKKTKMQLLWDMLSYNQAPRTQPLVFRIGYTW